MPSPLFGVYVSILGKAYPSASKARVEMAAGHLIERVRTQGHIETQDAASLMSNEIEKIIKAPDDATAELLAYGQRA